MTSPVPEIRVCGQQHRFELARRLILPPVGGQLHRSSGQIARKLLQARLKFFAQRKGVRHRSGKADHDLVVIDAADLFRARLHDGVLAHGHLPIAGDRGLSVFLHRDDGCAAEGTFIF